MKLDRKKVELEMARSCLSLSELAKNAEMPEPTVKNSLYGRSIRPRTAGLIARALGVDVNEIIIQEEV